MQAGIPESINDTTIPVRRILGRNPGPMTGPGTNSYLIGGQRLCLIDPGPADDEQLQSFIHAIGEARLEFVLVTHTHRDHSPGAVALARETGAELVGLPAPDAIAQDNSFMPNRLWQPGMILECDDFSLELIHTPGHVSNHLCYLLREEQLLFTGDHVLQGTTPVILPPDGSMGDYLRSLEFLQTLPLRRLAPGHGELMDQPQQEIARLISHRRKRESKLIEHMQALGPSNIDELVVPVYDDVMEHLIPWAKKTLLAHLVKLKEESRAVEEVGRWRLLK